MPAARSYVSTQMSAFFRAARPPTCPTSLTTIRSDSLLSALKGSRMRVSDDTRSPMMALNGRAKSANGFGPRRPERPPTGLRRASRMFLTSSTSATSDLPPLVGAAYTRFFPPASAPPVSRHLTCHSWRSFMSYLGGGEVSE